MTPDNLPSHRRRWDTDERGHGVASGEVLLPALDALRTALALPDWVAEDPERYLVEHIRRICSRDGAQLQLLRIETREAVLVITLRAAADMSRPAIRSEIMTITGAFVEASTFVRETGEDASVFDVATGMLDGDGPFVGHGHLIRFIVERLGP